jgi:hypothetical protein
LLGFGSAHDHVTELAERRREGAKSARSITIVVREKDQRAARVGHGSSRILLEGGPVDRGFTVFRLEGVPAMT